MTQQVLQPSGGVVILLSRYWGDVYITAARHISFINNAGFYCIQEGASTDRSSAEQLCRSLLCIFLLFFFNEKEKKKILL